MVNRRHFITSSIAAVGASQMPLATAKAQKTFPDNFMWGVATSAYQIEGAPAEDGKGESIWDRFVRTPGRISNNDTGDVACDSYHRLDDDLALLKALGVKSYRFSIAWTRVLPQGTGEINQKGLAYYRRLVDGLVSAGIRPVATLYHWDLPQALEDRGGWPNRDMADYFADYAALMAKELGGKVKHWALFNEPKSFVEMGYGLGLWAPGRQDPQAFFAASHVVNLAQGKAFRAMKAVDPTLKIGTAIDVSPVYPMTSSAQDKQAAQRQSAFTNLWYIVPALTGTYPQNVINAEQEAWMKRQPGDERLVLCPFDFIGLNNYTQGRAFAGTDANSTPPYTQSDWGNGDYPKTDIGWTIPPHALYDIIMLIHRAAPGVPIEITENGAAYNDGPNAGGKVNDKRRIAYYRLCLSQVLQAIRDGAQVQGYHAWSLMDNFEWLTGYSMRFGLVHVDYKTQKRTIKESGKWYARVIKANQIL